MSSSENIARYFPPTTAFLDTGCHVVSFGFEKVGPDMEYPLRQHPDDHLFSYERGRVLPTWVVGLILEGRGNFESEGSAPAEIRAGDLFLLFPNIRHRYRPQSDTGWSQWWIEITGPLAEKWVEVARLAADRPVLPQAGSSMLLDTFQELAAVTRDDHPLNPLLVSSLALQVVARAGSEREHQDPATERVMALVRRTRQLLREQTEKPTVDWDELSQSLGVSYSSLRHTFVKSVGLSPGKYHLFVRQRYAVSLLCNSDLPVGDIAHKLGFDSIYYFSRFIKQRTGLSPRKLRAQAATPYPAAAETEPGE